MLFIGDMGALFRLNQRLAVRKAKSALGVLHAEFGGYSAAQHVVLVFVLLLCAGSRADATDGVFIISAADTHVVDEVLMLNATMSYGLSDGAIEAVNRGVPLIFETQIELDRVRRYLPDPNVVQLVQRMQLSFHALTQRFVVKNLNSSEQWSYGTLSEALMRLGRLEALPIIDLALLDSRSQYTIAVRSVLDTKAYAAPLRMLAALFRVDDWRLESPWRRWLVRL